MSDKPDGDFWNTDEYLRRNAAGAHANTNVVISEIETVKAALTEGNSRLAKIERTLFSPAIGMLAAAAYLAFRLG